MFHARQHKASRPANDQEHDGSRAVKQQGLTGGPCGGSGLAQQLGVDRIRVNTVVPTYMWGPAVQGYVRRAAEQYGVSEEVVKGPITASMPLGEIPLDEDIAEAVAFFCSDRSRMITGQTLFVNAGEFFW